MEYLGRSTPARDVLVVAEQSTTDELCAAGITVTTNPPEREGRGVSFDRTFDYEKLNAAFQAVRYGGATIVATNPDPYCPTPEGGIPDCAAMLAAIEACSGAKAEAVVGKPSVHMAADCSPASRWPHATSRSSATASSQTSRWRDRSA